MSVAATASTAASVAGLIGLSAWQIFADPHAQPAPAREPRKAHQMDSVAPERRRPALAARMAAAGPRPACAGDACPRDRGVSTGSLSVNDASGCRGQHVLLGTAIDLVAVGLPVHARQCRRDSSMAREGLDGDAAAPACSARMPEAHACSRRGARDPAGCRDLCGPPHAPGADLAACGKAASARGASLPSRSPGSARREACAKRCSPGARLESSCCTRPLLA